MSEAACKVVIDWYAALGGEAAGLAALAGKKEYDALYAEASALATAAEGICQAGAEMVRYLESAPGSSNSTQVRQIVAMSRDACDWAKELRVYTDEVSTNDHTVTRARVAEMIADMRSWRDAGTALIRAIAESQM